MTARRATTTVRWALWRDGYLIHVQGDFHKKQDVKSLRKTWHALTIGAAIKQGFIPGLDQKVNAWVDGLGGPHADATWWHVLTQTSGFDYPYGEFPAFKPGKMWMYSDKNPRVLCNALARVFGKKDSREIGPALARCAPTGMMAAKNSAIPVQATTEAPLDHTTETYLPLSRIQRLIAGRMLASKRNKPCFYLETRADVTELMGMRHSLSKMLGVKITSNAFFIHAIGLTVRRYPLMVGRLAPGESGRNGDGWIVQIAENVNVGFAVNSPQGLVVPVVRYTEGLSLAEIAEEEKLLTAKARSNRLTLDDIEGETIALSNLGAYDIDSFLAIVPPPVSAIVSAGKVSLAAVPQDGRVVVRKMVSLSLAVDHRVIHCDYAARFLQSLAEQLSDPERLV